MRGEGPLSQAVRGDGEPCRPPPPKPPARVQPFGPGALIVIDLALTAPDESRWPVAVTHSPTARRADDDVTNRVTVVLLDTTTVTGLPVCGCTVIVLPLTFVSLPRTMAWSAGGPPPAPGLGLPRPGRGLNPPAPGP